MNLNEKKVLWMQETIDLVNRLLPLDDWHFKETARFFGNDIHPTLIYDSESCRIRISFTATDRRMDQGIILDYGKLDVPDHATILVGNAPIENYHLLWHSADYALYFLDGLSPREAKTAKIPRFVTEFRQSALAKTLDYQPEKDLVFHATMWEYYEQRLFDIFDDRDVDIWKHYCAFIREYWKALPQL